jgi:hypothetical protein
MFIKDRFPLNACSFKYKFYCISDIELFVLLPANWYRLELNNYLYTGTKHV